VRVRDRLETRMVESPAKAVGALPPEILELVSLVAEILLDQRRREVDLLRGELPDLTPPGERRDEGKAA
jgi:hypothetical protein